MLKKSFLLTIVAFSFISCGNGGGESINQENLIKTTIENPSLDDIKAEPYYQYAWHFNEEYTNFKQRRRVDNNSHINIEAAWEITKGKYQNGENKAEAVKIAVIDDNFDIYHEDIKDSIIESYDVDYEDNDVSSDSNGSSHGTPVASFITSTINNTGLVGSAPEAKLIVIKQEIVEDTKIIAAFEYARAKGAKVINCSWGTPGGPSQAVIEKMEELKAENIIIVFATGNEDQDLDEVGQRDDSEEDSVLGIGASSFDNNIALYSNYGSKMDIIAPGGEIIPSYGAGVLGAYSVSTSTNPISHYSSIDTTQYSFYEGTSFSAPIVTGVIALMFSVNPELTFDEVRTILIETADKINSDTKEYADLENDGTTSTWNTYRAYGKINAYAAVKKAQDMYK